MHTKAIGNVSRGRGVGEGGGLGSCSAWEGGKLLNFWKEEFAWGTMGMRKLYRLTIT